VGHIRAVWSITADSHMKERVVMPTSTKLTYYNGTMWQTVLLQDGTRAVTPWRSGSGPKIGATTRYYRRLARARQ
jgi:hypothetical protein